MEHRRERVRCLQELGLNEPVSEDDIKKAYKTAAFRYHPDKNPGKDTTSKFQQIHAAYKFLTEGDEFLRLARERQNAEEFSILRFLFPWLFGPQFYFRTTNPYYGYYDNMSDEEDEYDQYVPHKTYTTRGGYTAGGGGHTAYGAYAAGGGASGTSQHFNKNTNFTHTSAQHGQFFQETQSRGKAAKKRNREAKRATKLAADKERSEFGQETASNTDGRYRPTKAKSPTPPTKAKSPTPDLSGQQQTRNEDKSKSGQERESSQSPEKSQAWNNAEAKKNVTEDQTNKKSKKQIQMEEKQRDKEMKEIAEELVRQEKEKKEKLEKKRAIQEEKERQDREVRQKEEQENQEKERQRLEELRHLMEKKEDEKKRKKREAERIKKLFNEFDSCTFLDENGDFKYTDPEMTNIIRHQDVNHLGNASKNVPHKKFEAVNGMTTENLIKLQEAETLKNQPKPLQEKELGSPNHARLGPVGSRPQENHREDPSQQSSGPREYKPRYQQHQPPPQQHQPPPQQHQPPPQQHQPPPQQFYNHPPPPLRQPKVPYWSPSQPPPPLHSMNTNVPRASAHFSNGYAPNKYYKDLSFIQPSFLGKI